MEPTEEGKGNFILMPAKAGTCPICAVDHEEARPHNKQSLYYQTRFYMENGRYPTWTDAMAHCSDHMKDFWITELTKAGEKLD
jgi:hypothetical protein